MSKQAVPPFLYIQAVCCEDHQHCCPSGYTCNVAAQSCEKRHWPGPVAAAGGLLTCSQTAASSQDVLCDEEHYCHEDQTCCKAKRDSWACCPYKKVSAQTYRFSRGEQFKGDHGWVGRQDGSPQISKAMYSMLFLCIVRRPIFYYNVVLSLYKK